MHRPQTRYAKSGDVHIAYQVIGDGPLDIVLSPGFISNLDLHWEEPGYARLLRTLGSFARVIQFDKRGTGLSDRVGGIPTLEERMDDVRAVMDAVGSKSAAIFGASEGGAMAVLFAATYPKRTQSLILYGSYAHFHTWVLTPTELALFVANAEETWGTGSSLKSFAPTLANDAEFANWWARYERQGASPSAAIALARMNAEIDVRAVLPLIRVRTLVLHRKGDPRVKIEGGHYLARSIPGALYKELPGNSHPIWTGAVEDITKAVQEFLTGRQAVVAHDTVLATVLAAEFVCDTCGSDADASQLQLDNLNRADETVREAVRRFHGRPLDAKAGSWLAAFDGPVRAIRSAVEIRALLSESGLGLRAGLHAGELSIDVGEEVGLATRAARLVAAAAAPGEILVSGAVRDLVAGSGLMFREHGLRDIGGSIGAMRLFSTMDTVEAPRRGTIGKPEQLRAPQRLSRRELEIAGLLSRGLSNAEIAASLGISEHTVKRHVANILAKLDVPSRAAVASLAASGSLSIDE